MAKKKVSDFLVERLTQWGVNLVYGYAGDGINGILGALGRATNGPRLIQPPHEELCALMATAHAKFSGKVGVCLVTQGPGAVHALNGLYDAKLDHQPVVAILGQVSQAAGGSYYQQEIDLVSLFKDVAHEHVHVLSTPEQVHHLIDVPFEPPSPNVPSPPSSFRMTFRIWMRRKREPVSTASWPLRPATWRRWSSPHRASSTAPRRC